MRHWICACAVCLALFAVVATPVTAQEMSPTIRAGRVESSTREVRGNDIRSGRATVLVNAPLETVLREVTDYARYRDFMPRFRQSRPISGRGANRRVYMQVTILGGRAEIWALARFFMRAPRGETRVVEGQMVEGNVDGLWARWELTPVDAGAHTLVTFEMFVDPSFPAPASVVTSENERWATRAARALRTRIHRRATAQASAN